jgi:hypothetical protein
MKKEEKIRLIKECREQLEKCNKFVREYSVKKDREKRK